jgi:nitrogen fixation NifU-like protein
MSLQYTEKVMEHFTNPHNVGEIPDADGIGEVGNPVCLAKGTSVQLNNHLQEIESVAMSERVLTHEGVYSHIAHRSSRPYSGKMIRFKNKLGSIEMTPDHLMLAIKVPKGDKYLRTKGKMTLTPEWYHAEEIERRDIALYPILKETRDTEYFHLTFEKNEHDYRSAELPEKVPVDADFLRLAGYYLAEGNAVTKVTKAHLCFTFNINEMAYCEGVARIVKDKFGLEATIKTRPEHNSATVVVNSANLARIFEKTFGKGAADKRIPDFMFFLPPEKQAHLIEGLWKGDGYVNIERSSPRAGFATISRQLAGQMKVILLRMGIIPSMYHENGMLLEDISHQEAYRIHVGDRSSLMKLCKILGVEYVDERRTASHSWIADGYLHTPITGREEFDYSGEVYNFEIEGQHSYATDAFTPHNCGDLMWIYIKVKDDILTDVKFKTFGCGAAIATSSMITDLARGKTIQEGLKISRKDVAESLGGLPPQKMHCSNLAADGLHEAIHDYLRKQGREPPLPPDAKKPHAEEEEECFVESDSPIHIEEEAPKK